MKKLLPNMKEARRFKKFIHGNNPTVFQTYSKDAELEKWSKAMPGHANRKMLDQLVEANVAGMNVAMMINTGTSRKGAAVTKVNALFCDFDSGDKTVGKLLKLAIEPHLISQTSQGKYQVFWLVAHCDVSAFSEAQEALAEKLGGDPSVSDLSRTMRLPGTYNHKYTPPFLTTIVHVNKEAKPIPFTAFCRKFGITVGSAAISDARNTDRVKVEISEIKEALRHISPENRTVWIKVGMAIHYAHPSEVGRALWMEWASQSAKFDEAEHLKMWGKFKPDGGVTIRTLFSLAKLAGCAEQYGYDEAGMAKLFAETYKNELRYSPETRKWYLFDSVVWTETPAQTPQRFAREMVLDLGDSTAENALSRFKTVAGYRSITSHAELLPELQINVTEFDKNSNLLALKNGVIDLTTGIFRQAAPSDLLHRQANVEYSAVASAPTWIAFLKKVMCNDRELHDFIRRMVGYIMFGRADQQLFFLIIGSGGNGKGVFMHTVKSILGDYGINVPPNLLSTAYSGNANAPSPALATLKGARYVICTEMKSGKLDEAFVKQFAGGDEITARHTYGEVFTFKPEGKLVVSANHNDLPEIAADDKAMWRRLIPIPFNAEFVKGKNDDDKLEEKLTAEFPGILNWMLKGAIAYRQDGLGSCAAVEKTKDKLRKDADSLLSWMSDRCIERSNLKTAAGAAYESYRAFMDHKGKKPVTVQAFKAGLSRKGFHHRQTSKHNVYVGLGLR